MSDIVRMIEEASAETREWTKKGWKVTFGHRQIEANSLEAAEKLPQTEVYRLEAIAYWNRVKNAAEDALIWGGRALEDAKKGDLKGAEDAVYYAQFCEFPIREISPTWGPVFEAIRKAQGKSAA